MSLRKPVDAKAGVLMAMLCAVWGFQQVALKAAAPDMAPVLQVAVRSGVAALAVFALVLWRRETGALKAGTWKPGLAAGALFALEFLCVGEGLRFTSASHMAVFLYTAPVFAALGLHLKLAEERLAPGNGSASPWPSPASSSPWRDRARRRRAAGRAMWIGDSAGRGRRPVLGGHVPDHPLCACSRPRRRSRFWFQLFAASTCCSRVAVLSGQTRIAPTPLLLSSLPSRPS